MVFINKVTVRKLSDWLVLLINEEITADEQRAVSDDNAKNLFARYMMFFNNTSKYCNSLMLRTLFKLTTSFRFDYSIKKRIVR